MEVSEDELTTSRRCYESAVMRYVTQLWNWRTQSTDVANEVAGEREPVTLAKVEPAEFYPCLRPISEHILRD